jgi:bifunctional non-homologous end joining protein LigD
VQWPSRSSPQHAAILTNGWTHEVKFDGYRVQAHKMGSRVVLFSRNAMTSLSVLPRSRRCFARCRPKRHPRCEFIANDADGRPNFAKLQHVRWNTPGTLHLWAFDLLALNGQDWRP